MLGLIWIQTMWHWWNFENDDFTLIDLKKSADYKNYLDLD